MANNTQALQRRLKSVRSTQKITKAMQLVAISKLLRFKNRCLKNGPYANGLKELVQQVLATDTGLEHPLLRRPEKDDNPYYIVYTSDLGLAGGYNQNVFKFLKENNIKQGSIYWIGQKGHSIFVREGYPIINSEVVLSDPMDYATLKELGLSAVEQFSQGKITSINVISTEFINATTYKVKKEVLLPISLEANSQGYQEVIYDPSPKAILRPLIERYIVSELYQQFLNSKTSEYSSRQFAMKTATDNAQELIDNLQLEYNKLRQQAITQEIIEIVSGSIGG